jgi:hypothetical protein
MLEKSLRITYLLIWPLFYILSFLLFKQTNLSFIKNSFSELGSVNGWGVYFDILLILAGTAQLGVFYLFSKKYILSQLAMIGIAFFTTTTLAGILVGLVTLNINSNLHFYISLVGFLFSIIGWIFFGVSLIRKNTAYFIIMFFWGLIVVPASIIFLYDPINRILPAIGEMSMFMGAYLTGLIMFRLA